MVMAALGKTIRIYLADGTSGGIRHAELVNWSGQAMVCPRSRFQELSGWHEAQRPGVYVLVGEDESGGVMIYIGEAENVLTRLQSHLKNKDFWTRVVFFTSKDENLTKAHVKYLEACLIDLAIAAGRSRVENGNSPQRPALPRADRDAMEEFLGPIATLLGALGFSFLQSIPAASGGPNAIAGASHGRLFFKPTKRVIDAQGAWIDDEFVVYAGSVGDLATRHHLGSGYRQIREALMEDKSIEKASDTTIRFARDVPFTSPSAAASVLAGGAYNGREAWKDKNGRSLKAIEEELAESSGKKARKT
jgi:hypothetical protein